MRAIPALVALALLTGAAPASAELKPVHQHGEQAERQFERRLIDVALRGGVALAECPGGCQRLRPFGPAAGLILTLRANEEISVGVSVERAWFTERARDGATSTSDVTAVGIVGRLYLSTNGRLEPWVELIWLPPFGFGAGGGLDLFATKIVKVGPYARFEIPMSETQHEEAVASGAGASEEPVRGLLQLGLAVTFTFGSAVR